MQLIATFWNAFNIFTCKYVNIHDHPLLTVQESVYIVFDLIYDNCTCGSQF